LWSLPDRLLGSDLFIPTAEFNLDQVVRNELADSLEYLVAMATEMLGSSDVDAGQVIRNLRDHRLDPVVFARYYELVLAIQRGQSDIAVRLYREIADRSHLVASFAVLSFGDPTLENEVGRYLRCLSPGQTKAGLVEAPDRNDWAAFAAHMPAALDLIAAADPGLAAELRSSVVHIVGASANRDASQTFGGASSFMLWGAVFLNVALHRTRTEIAAGLVHESAHQVLFALSCREPVVENALEARFASPLRRDPRPIIGVYHATFVCARMGYAFRAMLARDCGLDDSERVSLAQQLDKARADFVDGLATLRTSGHLTPLGTRILDEAAASLDVN
jgi:hypothetical protein